MTCLLFAESCAREYVGGADLQTCLAQVAHHDRQLDGSALAAEVTAGRSAGRPAP
jgi:hypothetical protein